MFISCANSENNVTPSTGLSYPFKKLLSSVRKARRSYHRRRCNGKCNRYNGNIAPVPTFVYNSRKNGKNQKRRHGFWATLYKNIRPKFELKRLKICCTRTWYVRPISWKYGFEKKSKTVSETFLRLIEIKTTRRESNCLRHTNKRPNLLHSDADMTRCQINTVSRGNLTLHFSSTRHRCWSLAPKVNCYCRIGSVSSQFPKFSFLWLVICTMNRPKQS